MEKKIYNVFRRRMIVLIFVVLTFSTAIISALIYNGFTRAYSERTSQDLVSRGKACLKSLDIFLEERKAVLSAVADMGSIDVFNSREKLKDIFENINFHTKGGLTDLGLINSEGEHLAYVGPYSLEGLNYKNQDWFAMVMARGFYVSDVYCGYRNFPHFVVAVKSGDFDKSFILRATIDLNRFEGIVKNAQTGNCGDAFIVNKQGAFQTLPRFGSKKILDKWHVNANIFADDFSIKKDLEKNLYVSGTWLTSKDWLLVVTQSSQTRFAAFFVQQKEVVFTIVIAFSALALVIVFGARFGVRSLSEKDRELDELNSQLIQSEKLASLGRMAAGVAHEINNPLEIISENAGWIKDILSNEKLKSSFLLGELQEVLSIIEKNVERAGRVTKNMLGFARGMEPKRDKISLSKVLGDTKNFIMHQAKLRGVSFVENYDEGLPYILSDKSKLQQVFFNLINNALDESSSDEEIILFTNLDKGRVSASVIDHGKGMNADLQKKIFDPFFTTKEPGKGTGLGLFITHKIVSELGGRIEVFSKPGKGSEFRVSFSAL